MAEEVKVTFKTEPITIKKDDKEDVKLKVGTSYKVLVKNCVKVYKLENNNITEDAESKETLQIRIVVGNYVGYAGTEGLDEATKDTFLAFEKVKDNDTDKTQLYIKVDDIQSIEPDQSVVVSSTNISNTNPVISNMTTSSNDVDKPKTLKDQLEQITTEFTEKVNKPLEDAEKAVNDVVAETDEQSLTTKVNEANNLLNEAVNIRVTYVVMYTKFAKPNNVNDPSMLVFKNFNKKIAGQYLKIQDHLKDKQLLNLMPKLLPGDIKITKDTTYEGRIKTTGGATKRRLSKKHKKTRKAKRSGRK